MISLAPSRTPVISLALSRTPMIYLGQAALKSHFYPTESSCAPSSRANPGRLFES